jgi:hypothetical protein
MPSIDALVLAADGIGPVAFGASQADTLTVLEAALGPFSSDVINAYPIDRGDGTFYNAATGGAFAYPAEYTTCFDNALCVVFGGAPGSLTFVGWVQNNQGVDPPLRTIDDVTAGSIWADHLDDLEVPDAGCYSYTIGSTRGIVVGLYSNGEPFLAYDDAGNQIETDPDPADVTVVELSAGDLPFNPEEDC